MSGAISYSLPLDDDTSSSSQSGRTSPGGNVEIQWEIVARTPGLMPANIIVGRLQAEGIPARAWQEGAGRALGLTVGILGTGYVAVPQEYAEEASRILDEVDEAQADGENMISDYDEVG